MKKETVILCNIPSVNDPTSFYRAAGPLGHLRRNSERPFSYIMTDEISWSLLSMCDLVFMQRPSTAKHVQAVKLAKDMGKPVWVDYDDDLLSVPTDNPTFVIYGRIDIQKNVAEIVQMADAVTVSTQSLADNWTSRGLIKDYSIIENALDINQFPWATEGPTPERTNTVMWRGSPSHFRDVLSVTPDLTTTINDSKNWTFEFMGDRLWFLTDRCDPTKTRFAAPTGIVDYFKHIYAAAPRIFIAPLIDTGFNRAKSNIAWLEATFAGAVCIAPNLPEWTRCGVINYGRDLMSFKTALESTMNMVDEERSSLWKQSWETILEKYNLDTQNQKREAVIASLV